MQRRRDELASRLAEAEGRAASAEEGEARFTAEFRQLAAERDQLRDALDRVRLFLRFQSIFSASVDDPLRDRSMRAPYALPYYIYVLYKHTTEH